MKKPDLQKPRSQLAHKRVIDSAIELFASQGIDGTSIDGIAAASGVSKATIYKHWANKDELILEAICRAHGLDQQPVSFDSGDLLQDLVDFLKQRPPDTTPLRERLMPHVVAYASRNKEFGIAWRTRAVEPSRLAAMELLRRGVDQGLFRGDMDMSIGSVLLIGPVMYAHLFRSILPIPDNLAEEVAHAFWRAFAEPSARSTERELSA